jgi:uncharacterized protein involved in exopolysaccharide biosynthesis
MNKSTDDPEGDSELDLFAILSIVWRHKWFVTIVTAFWVIGALVYTFTATEWYRAEVLMKPADNRASQGIASSLGGLTGLAGIAGISLGGNNAAEPMAVLSSRELTGEFIQEQNLLPVLFSKRWDAERKQWRTSTFTKAPDIRDGVRYFDKTIREVKEDKKSGLVMLTIEWTDPTLAAKWANLLAEKVNESMRARALTEAQANVEYLKQELGSSSVVPLQQTIGRVLETELQKLMLAKGNKEFGFKILDHAQVPKWRIWPHRLTFVVTAFFLGLVTSTVYLVATHLIRKKRRAEAA